MRFFECTPLSKSRIHSLNLMLGGKVGVSKCERSHLSTKAILIFYLSETIKLSQTIIFLAPVVSCREGVNENVNADMIGATF